MAWGGDGAREISFYRGAHLSAAEMPLLLPAQSVSRAPELSPEAILRKKWLEGAASKLSSNRRTAKHSSDPTQFPTQDSMLSVSTCLAGSRGGASCTGSSRGRWQAGTTFDSLPGQDEPMYRTGSGSNGHASTTDFEDIISRLGPRLGPNEMTMESLQEWEGGEDGDEEEDSPCSVAPPRRQVSDAQAVAPLPWFPERWPTTKLSPRKVPAIEPWTPPTREQRIEALSPALQRSLNRAFPEWRKSKGLFRMP